MTYIEIVLDLIQNVVVLCYRLNTAHQGVARLMTPCGEITGHPLLCRQRLRDQNVVEVLQNLHKITWKLFKKRPKQGRPAECTGPVGAAFWRPKCRPNPSKLAQSWSKIC